jgi:hypothetical protein
MTRIAHGADRIVLSAMVGMARPLPRRICAFCDPHFCSDKYCAKRLKSSDVPLGGGVLIVFTKNLALCAQAVSKLSSRDSREDWVFHSLPSLVPKTCLRILFGPWPRQPNFRGTLLVAMVKFRLEEPRFIMLTIRGMQVMAGCTTCGQKFFTFLALELDVNKAERYLRERFVLHMCRTADVSEDQSSVG